MHKKQKKTGCSIQFIQSCTHGPSNPPGHVTMIKPIPPKPIMPRQNYYKKNGKEIRRDRDKKGVGKDYLPSIKELNRRRKSCLLSSINSSRNCASKGEKIFGKKGRAAGLEEWRRACLPINAFTTPRLHIACWCGWFGGLKKSLSPYPWLHLSTPTYCRCCHPLCREAPCHEVQGIDI